MTPPERVCIDFTTDPTGELLKGRYETGWGETVYYSEDYVSNLIIEHKKIAREATAETVDFVIEYLKKYAWTGMTLGSAINELIKIKNKLI